MSTQRTPVDDELDALEYALKDAAVGDALAGAGVNVSLALVTLDALRAYLQGRKQEAVEDLETVTEEIRHRLPAGTHDA